MTKLFDTALPPLWYLVAWVLLLALAYLVLRFGIAHGLRDAGITPERVAKILTLAEHTRGK